ncbi:YciI family protein [Oerskovia enterophila]
MSTEYAVLIHAPEDGTPAMRPDLAEEIMAQHEEFTRRVEAEGHRISGGVELEAAGTATLVRPGVGTTEGPFTELAEQIGGIYLVVSEDLPGLVTIIDEVFAGDGCTYEIRPTVDHGGADAAAATAAAGAEA